MNKRFVIIIIGICKLLASVSGRTFNVGSVLFAKEDAAKELWTLQSVELLRTRKHFQRILMPLFLASQPMNDQNLQSLLKHFNNVYKHVNQSATEDSIDSIMKAAITDIFGGFIKFYVIPVTKYAFYGGVVKQETVNELSLMYDKIKRYLQTDGKAWRSPDQRILDNIVIDVAPTPRNQYSNFIRTDPCKRLGYFEKTEKGLFIPMPSINWDERSLTMFLPLKNETLVSLMSLNAFSSLMRYYEAARECVNVYSPVRSEDFEDKFQSWLIKEIVPHLSDDQTYPGLGGILSLMNIAKFSDTVIVGENNPKGIIEQVAYTCGIQLKTLKKLLIILILVWICIPASIFLYCQRKFKKVNKNISKVTKQYDGNNTKRYVDIEQSENNVWNIETFAKTVISKNNKNKKSIKNNTDPILTANESVMTKFRKDKSSSTFFKTKEPYQRLSSMESDPPSQDSIPPFNNISQYTTITTCSEKPYTRTLRIIEESQDSLEQDPELDSLGSYNDSRTGYIIEPTKTVTLFRSERDKRHRSHSSFSRTVSDNIEAEAALINELAAEDIHASSKGLSEKVKNPFLFCINEVDAHSSPSSQESTSSDKTSILTSKPWFSTLETKRTVEMGPIPRFSAIPKPDITPRMPTLDEVVAEEKAARLSKIPKWTPPVKVSMPRHRLVTPAQTNNRRSVTSALPRISPKSKLPTRKVQDDTVIKRSPRKNEKLNVTL